jgi:hypothetical protein
MVDERKKVGLFELLVKGLALQIVPRVRTKRKHGMCGRLPVWGPTFRYRVTRTCTGVDTSDRSWKGHARARRIARASA